MMPVLVDFGGVFVNPYTVVLAEACTIQQEVVSESAPTTLQDVPAVRLLLVNGAHQHVEPASTDPALVAALLPQVVRLLNLGLGKWCMADLEGVYINPIHVLCVAKADEVRETKRVGLTVLKEQVQTVVVTLVGNQRHVIELQAADDVAHTQLLHSVVRELNNAATTFLDPNS